MVSRSLLDEDRAMVIPELRVSVGSESRGAGKLRLVRGLMGTQHLHSPPVLQVQGGCGKASADDHASFLRGEVEVE